MASNFKKLLRIYRRNEDLNAHCENALLLVKEFGTEAEVAQIQDIMRERDKNEGLSMEQSHTQYLISNKYFVLLVEGAKRESTK